MSKPPECHQCKRLAKVLYQESPASDSPVQLLCRDCACSEEKMNNPSAAISCANCQTTLDAVRSGQPLGCSHCYTIFGDFLLDELLSEYVPSRFQQEEGFQMPVQPGVLDNKIAMLHTYLEEALHEEDYEQVSRLHHQIELLRENALFSFSSFSQNPKNSDSQ